MPRSPADATRFTATGPHAHSKSSYISSASPAAASSSPNETPLERVARLKAAAQRARAQKLTTFDRTVIRGRVWADRAHRFVALSLIGATAVCGIYATVALSDMILYNRRKRREFNQAQTNLYATHLAEARAALKTGTLTAQQQGLLEHEESLKLKTQGDAAKKSILGRTRDWLLSGLKKDEGEAVEGEGVVDATSQSGGLVGVVGDDADGERTGGVAILKAVEEHHLGEREQQSSSSSSSPNGGMLDQLGGAGGGWSSWFGGKKGSNGGSS